MRLGLGDGGGLGEGLGGGGGGGDGRGLGGNRSGLALVGGERDVVNALPRVEAVTLGAVGRRGGGGGTCSGSTRECARLGLCGGTLGGRCGDTTVGDTTVGFFAASAAVAQRASSRRRSEAAKVSREGQWAPGVAWAGLAGMLRAELSGARAPSAAGAQGGSGGQRCGQAESRGSVGAMGLCGA